jgi:thiol-disulfide isomerase/thioredoxin
MRSIRIVLLFVVVLALVLLAIQSEYLTHFLIGNLNSSWMMGYLLPRLIMIVLSATLVAITVPLFSFTTKGRIALGVVLFSCAVGGYLAINLPYASDWKTQGEDISGKLSGSEIESVLNSESPDFDGLILLALPNCPYCFVAYPNVELLKKRNPDLDVVVFVSARDTAGVSFFREKVGESEIQVYLISDRKQATELSEGRFPTFLYFKNGKVVYRWANNQLGFPALDWVENRLN